ncbi:MAG TPA: helix-turn-helix transcriptional regulator, partial [Thermoanaerobaculia bacterium]|nr:helix-turn-helix transcriptional regulator [Thermoanaerobaculia bacterium]
MPKTIPCPEGATLHLFRVAKGLSLKAFALLHGVSVGMVSGWETGRPLSRKRLGELLAPLGIPPEAIDTVLLGYRMGSPPDEP